MGRRREGNTGGTGGGVSGVSENDKRLTAGSVGGFNHTDATWQAPSKHRRSLFVSQDFTSRQEYLGY